MQALIAAEPSNRLLFNCWSGILSTTPSWTAATDSQLLLDLAAHCMGKL
jgi:hypothetical protein